MEGYASGRFETQADVARFLQAHPLFPRGKSGKIANERVRVLLHNPVYAGFVEAPAWGVTLRKGHHQPLIDAETYRRVKDKLAGISVTPKRPNLNADFPLRGFVLCADCGSALTACWSTGKIQRHPYYLCPKRGCASYGKSIRRDLIEGEFEQMLRTVQPTPQLFKVARTMFEDIWTHRLAQTEQAKKALAAQADKIEKQVAQLLERVLDATVPSVVAAYESRIAKLEEQRLLIAERMASAGQPASSFDATLRTALGFLASPWKLWSSDRLEDKRAVLKLTFATRLRYQRGEGLRTGELALPFKLLAGISAGEKEMARPKRLELLTPRFVV